MLSRNLHIGLSCFIAALGGTGSRFGAAQPDELPAAISEARDAHLHFKGLDSAPDLAQRLERLRLSTANDTLTYWVALNRWHNLPGFRKLRFAPLDVLKSASSTRPEAKRVIEAVAMRDPAVFGDGSSAERLATEAREARDAVALLEIAETLIKVADGKRPELERKAREWATNAHGLGNDRSLYTLAYLARSLDGDMKKWQDLLRRAGEAGDYRASFELGMAYMRGQQVPASPGEARQWLERSAAMHHPPALREYGRAVVTGYGSNDGPDPERGRQLLESAVEQGDGEAALLVARAMLQGELGYSQDVEQGMDIIRSLATQGHPQAMYLLGTILKSGSFGVTADEQLGRDWLRKAADLGHEEAKAALVGK